MPARGRDGPARCGNSRLFYGQSLQPNRLKPGTSLRERGRRQVAASVCQRRERVPVLPLDSVMRHGIDGQTDEALRARRITRRVIPEAPGVGTNQAVQPPANRAPQPRGGRQTANPVVGTAVPDINLGSAGRLKQRASGAYFGQPGC